MWKPRFIFPKPSMVVRAGARTETTGTDGWADELAIPLAAGHGPRPGMFLRAAPGLRSLGHPHGGLQVFATHKCPRSSANIGPSMHFLRNMLADRCVRKAAPSNKVTRSPEKRSTPGPERSASPRGVSHDGSCRLEGRRFRLTSFGHPAARVVGVAATWWRWADHLRGLHAFELWRLCAMVAAWRDAWWCHAFRAKSHSEADTGRARCACRTRRWDEVIQRHVNEARRSEHMRQTEAAGVRWNSGSSPARSARIAIGASG